jgi:hypothetical protein
MVRLLETQIRVLIEVLTTMADVDDMYILERLYAVSFGCAMRTADISSLELLANHVYQLVFEAGRPTPHILMRDYAKRSDRGSNPPWGQLGHRYGEGEATL